MQQFNRLQHQLHNPSSQEILYDAGLTPKIDERSEEQESMSMSMQQEAISLIEEAESNNQRAGATGQSVRKQEVSSQMLSVSDHLTQKDAIDFWHRYFADEQGQVHLDLFCDAVQSEFSSNVFVKCFDDQHDDNVNEDDVMQDFYGDLQGKVSID